MKAEDYERQYLEVMAKYNGGKIYNMGKIMFADIDCRVIGCIFYDGAGRCSNPAPAITLRSNKSFVCWSSTDKD